MTQAQLDAQKTQRSSINPSSCSPFIIGFVDSRVIQNGKPDGLFFIDTNGTIDDRRHGLTGSTGEGTNHLSAACKLNAYIAWVAYGFNPYDSVQIQVIGNSAAWGAKGQPFPAGDDVFTGQVVNPVGGNYQIELAVKPANAPNFVHPQTKLDMNVVSQ
ncbi:hypothetical protein KTO58_02655 [Chitinophaga pendula]|uniref:hypothetical protein n=1 Tax=Chitinophaga TaxID=79328 RepID=UPI000BAFB515|nr:MULTISPECIES: hypothetical protein [Chitinophaga]ASZ14256.1 hypothetical protein CK934_26565 [Chitinophaga sp. MD30]UCJ08100.1 hypothetical protein KTO58_02655 [Chitinophaga pendula]